MINSAEADSNDIPEAVWQTLYRVLGGHIYFQTLSAAVQLGLFDLLKKHGPLTRPQVADHLGISEQPARILLLGCCALDLVEKAGTEYSNALVADQLLVRDVPGSLVPIVEWQHFINYRPMYFFAEALKANANVGLQIFEGEEDTLYERLAHSPPLEKIFQEAMESISVQANQMLADHVDFSAIRNLVDVGGGNASNIITLARKYPKLQASVFDSPSVCQIARDNIKKAGLSDRLSATEGDCFRDPFPAEADCILFCHFLTIWSEDQNRQLLSKCYDALPQGGKAMVFNMMQDDDEKGPLTAAMGSPYFLTLATGTGMLYSWADYRSWMSDAGFTAIEEFALPRDHGVLVGTK